MVCRTQDRIIVHKSLDVFEDTPRAEGSSQATSWTRVEAKRGRGAAAVGVSRRKHIGYTDRHIRRHVKQESSLRTAQHRAQPQVSSTTPYFVPVPEGPASCQPALAELEGSMAATRLEDGSRSEGHMYAAGEGGRDEQAPLRWQRISAAIPGPPRHDYTSSTMDREDNGRLRRSIQRQEYDGSGPLPGEDAGYPQNGYPERVGGDEVFFGGARRSTGEPERVDEYDEHGNRRVELDNRSSGTDRRRVARQQDGIYPSEEAGYVIRDHHHHDPEGPGIRRLRRQVDRDGREEGEYTYADGDRERGDLQPNGCADGRTGVYDVGQGGEDGRSGEERSGGRESYRYSPRVRYRQHHRHDDDHHEGSHHLRHGDGVGFSGRGPRNSSSSGSSDRGSSGKQNFTQVDAVEGSTVADPGRSRAKRVEFSQCIQGPAQEPQAPRSSVRRHLVSPKALLPQRAAASPKVQKCAQDSPAKRWRSQAERSLSPVSTGTRTCAADGEDKTTPASLNEALVKTPKDMLLFSKKARQVDYKPCTLKEYRETKPTGYVELGKLQPDLYTEELVAKRANAERIKEFSTNLRKINSDTAAARGDSDRRPRPKKKDQDSRTRALAFARKIPLPRKVVKAQQPPAADPGDPGERRRAGRRGRSRVPETEGWRSAEMTELESLEAMHDDMRKKVQEARSSF